MTGFICLDKPMNITSFSAVGIMKRATGEKKAGHTGTLDPMATGVLPVAFGAATRFIELFPTHDKGYVATVKLGTVTDTLDITGNVLSVTESHITLNELNEALSLFRGEIKQVPPMYSAIRKNGVRLYELARRGEETEREERDVIIHSLELLDFDEKNQEFSISVDCSAGTYIRSLACDIGEKLGCGAVLTSLRRTKALGFTLENCVNEDELKMYAREGRLGEILIKVEDALAYEKIEVTESQAKRFHNGGFLSTERIKQDLKPKTLYRVFSVQGEFTGIGETDESCAQLDVKRVYMGDMSNG